MNRRKEIIQHAQIQPWNSLLQDATETETSVSAGGQEGQKSWRTWISSLVRVNTNQEGCLAAATKGETAGKQIILCLLRALLLPLGTRRMFSCGGPWMLLGPPKAPGQRRALPWESPHAPTSANGVSLRVQGAACTPRQATAAKCIEKYRRRTERLSK